MTSDRIGLPDGQQVAYTLKSSTRRRTVALRVGADGLVVHVPSGVPRAWVEQLLRGKADWIVDKLALWPARPPASVMQDGAVLHFLGQDIRVCLRQDALARSVTFDGVRLHVAVPDPQDTAAVRRQVLQWYAQAARDDFARRIALLAARLHLPVPEFRLSNARTRWGSCNARGRIRLHWRLIQAPPRIVHYVIAHELAHLKEMNHGPAFWAWVAQLCPEYKTVRRELYALALQLHRL